MKDTVTTDRTCLAAQALPIGAILSDGQFTITDHLGAGGFGITYRARDNALGRTIVLKECFPEDFCVRDGNDVFARSESYVEPVRSIVSMFMREARSLAKLRHPNIVGVHGVFEENGTAYMVLELIDGFDLLDVLETKSAPLSPDRVKHILLQLLDAIEKVHEFDLLHRDISPDNIILEKSGAPVLIDFGAARADASRRTRAISSVLVVKDGYSPQEFYISGSEQSPSSDLYALAATFYHVLSGEAPPHSQTRMIEVAGRRPDPCRPLAGRIDGYDLAFLQAIDQAMQIHPSDRLQSAAMWRDLVSDTGARDGPSPQTQTHVTGRGLDSEFRRSLSRLVEETNVDVRKSEPIPIKRATPPPETKKTEKPEWVEEFNKESLALISGSESDATSSDTSSDGVRDPGIVEAHGARIDLKRDQREIDWINRALEKQERKRCEIELERRAVEPERPRPAFKSKPPLTARGFFLDGAAAHEMSPRFKQWSIGIFGVSLIGFCLMVLLPLWIGI